MCRLSRCTQNPNHEHWATIAQCMKHLRSSMDCGILYNVFPVVLEWYNDVN